ncbi:MAG: hypothetical protein AAGC67_08930 [Myxococcota bacterium]
MSVDRGTTSLDRIAPLDESNAWGAGPSEPQSATEHQAALDATVFRSTADPFELVLELDAGQLRLRPGAREG